MKTLKIKKIEKNKTTFGEKRYQVVENQSKRKKMRKRKKKTGKNIVLPRRIEISTYLHKIGIARVLECWRPIGKGFFFSDCYVVKLTGKPLAAVPAIVKINGILIPIAVGSVVNFG